MTTRNLDDALVPGLSAEERAGRYIDWCGDALDAAYGFRVHLVKLLDAHARDAENLGYASGYERGVSDAIAERNKPQDPITF